VTWQTLDDVASEALTCTKCRLSQGRTQVVFMDGNPESDLMFIGEAPGYHEDQQGLPFVGAAGQLLDRTLETIGLSRNDCVIVNCLKCRPPGNRDPLPDEIELCRPYLEAQIHFIRPKVIVTLGNFATRFVLARQVSISRVRGQRFSAYGATVIPTFHPAAVLRGGGLASKAMESLRSDFRLVEEVLKESREAATYEPTEQQALF
jgi:uracil-DNA glycosylase family 4